MHLLPRIILFIIRLASTLSLPVSRHHLLHLFIRRSFAFPRCSFHLFIAEFKRSRRSTAVL